MTPPIQPQHCDHERVWCHRCKVWHMPMLAFGVLPVVSCPKMPEGHMDIVPSPQFERAVGKTGTQEPPR